MKFFVAFAALIAVAVATNRPLTSDDDGIAAIIAAIHSPSTDPATAYLLQQQLVQILGYNPTSVGRPVIIDQPTLLPEIVSPEIEGPTSVGRPVMIDQPSLVPEIVSPEIVAPAPVPSAPESQSAPLVQIIVNVQSQQSVDGPSPGLVVSPIEVPSTLPELVHIVDQAPELVNVVDQAPELVNVVDQAPELVNVVDVAPETVQTLPILLPSPVNVPDTLN